MYLLRLGANRRVNTVRSEQVFVPNSPIPTVDCNCTVYESSGFVNLACLPKPAAEPTHGTKC